MADSRNPFGLNTVTPYLVTEDAPALIEFLRRVFGAELRGEPHTRDNGRVKHAEVQIGDSVLMMGERPPGGGCQTGMFYIYVDDCDATYARAIEAGAVSKREPSDQPHGDRYGGFEDFAGNVWWAVTHVGSKRGEKA